MGPQRMFGMTPWVRRLFVANLVVFLFQMTIFVDPRFLTTFGFVPLRALAQPWTFLTYMFLHGGPLHLAFNLLALYVFGPEEHVREERRSEEHTSELQSRLHLVCRLLLEKKKKIKKKTARNV